MPAFNEERLLPKTLEAILAEVGRVRCEAEIVVASENVILTRTISVKGEPTKIKLPVTKDAADYKPGDLVTWNLDPRHSTPHIGIVMPKRSKDGKRPLILNNLGRGQITEDILFAFPITGQYRYAID